MITKQQWEQVLAGIASGLNNDDACASAGVSRSLFYKKTKEELDFLDRYKRAKIQFKHYFANYCCLLSFVCV